MAKQQKTNYGLALRAYMGVSGISCVDLAKKIGKSPSLVSYFRRQESWPESSVEEICIGLGTKRERLDELYRKLPSWMKS